MQDPDDQLSVSCREDASVKLALFNCAVQSYRFETAARPFPPQFRSLQQADHHGNVDDAKDIESLRLLLNNICDNQLVDFLNHSDSCLATNIDSSSDRSAVSLRNWLSTGLSYSLERLSLSDALKDIECRVAGFDKVDNYHQVQEAQQHRPSLVYRVRYSDKVERRFNELKSSRGTFFGYHGSRADNLHSILSNGLCAHLSYGRQPLYGEGIYLSTDIGVALAFAAAGNAQPLSKRLQCVVVGEVIDQPDLVKRRRRISRPSQDGVNPELDSSDLPPEYYVVCSNQLVIVRYLLLFSTTVEPRLLGRRSKRTSVGRSTDYSSYLTSLVRQNRAWLVALLYLLLLLLLPRLHSLLSAWLTSSRSAGGVDTGLSKDDEAELEAAFESISEAASSSNSDGSDESVGWGFSWGAD